MGRVAIYHSDEDDIDHYHLCDNCLPGGNILPENRKSGVGVGRTRCDYCDDLINKGLC